MDQSSLNRNRNSFHGITQNLTLESSRSSTYKSPEHLRLYCDDFGWGNRSARARSLQRVCSRHSQRRWRESALDRGWESRLCEVITPIVSSLLIFDAQAVKSPCSDRRRKTGKRESTSMSHKVWREACPSLFEATIMAAIIQTIPPSLYLVDMHATSER